MIKHFSIFYVGQIELKNVGVDGVPPDERLYANDRDEALAFGKSELFATLIKDIDIEDSLELVDDPSTVSFVDRRRLWD